MRNELLNQLRLLISTAVGANGSRGIRFLQEINDFPDFYIIAIEETRTHYGDGRKLGNILVECRLFTMVDNCSDIETLVRRVENEVQNLKCAAHEIRIVSISTDNGLFLPYSIADITFEIIYEVEIQ